MSDNKKRYKVTLYVEIDEQRFDDPTGWDWEMLVPDVNVKVGMVEEEVFPW
jgi:hypothetical protein